MAARVVIFCDDDFWHGRHWLSLKRKLRKETDAGYWLSKIKANIHRDARVTALLESEGWRVIRIWDGDVRRDPFGIALRVKDIVDSRLRDAKKA